MRIVCRATKRREMRTRIALSGVLLGSVGGANSAERKMVLLRRISPRCRRNPHLRSRRLPLCPSVPEPRFSSATVEHRLVVCVQVLKTGV